jgi:hypothetical protein
MAVSDAAGRALGKLLGAMENPRWGAEAAGTAVGYLVINHVGKKVKAWRQHQLHHDRGHLGDMCRCADGHEYFVNRSGAAHRYNPSDNSWYHATPKD